MAYALLTHAIASSADSLGVTTGAIDTSGASLLVVSLASHSGASENTLSDSKSNTWIPLTDPGGVIRLRLFYATNPTVGSGHTFTASDVVSSFPAVAVASFSGANTSSPFDVENGASGLSFTTLQPGSITPTEDNELVISALTHQQLSDPVGIDGGFTITDQVQLVGGLAFGLAFAYLIQTSAAAANPTWSINDAANGSAVIASFKVPAAGGHPTSKRAGGVPYMRFPGRQW